MTSTGSAGHPNQELWTFIDTLGCLDGEVRDHPARQLTAPLWSKEAALPLSRVLKEGEFLQTGFTGVCSSDIPSSYL